MVASAVGGASETVVHNSTGVLLDSFEASDLKAAIEKASGMDPAFCRKQAWSFDRNVFRANIRSWIETSGGDAAAGGLHGRETATERSL